LPKTLAYPKNTPVLGKKVLKKHNQDG